MLCVVTTFFEGGSCENFYIYALFYASQSTPAPILIGKPPNVATDASLGTFMLLVLLLPIMTMTLSVLQHKGSETRGYCIYDKAWINPLSITVSYCTVHLRGVDSAADCTRLNSFLRRCDKLGYTKKTLCRYFDDVSGS